MASVSFEGNDLNLILQELKSALQCDSCYQVSDVLINNTICRHGLCSACLQSNQCPCCKCELVHDDRSPNIFVNGVVKVLKEAFSNLNKLEINGSSNIPDKKDIVENDNKNISKLNKSNNLVPKSPASKSASKDQKKNSKGETPLQIACKKSDVIKAKHLLEDGANPNTKDYAGWTPLHEAVLNNNLVITESLLCHGALVNVPGFDQITPLHTAVDNGYTEIVKLLLKHGADKTMRDSNGKTPIDYSKNKEIADILKMYNAHNNDKIICKAAASKPTLIYILDEVDQNIRQKFIQRFEKSADIKITSKLVKEITHLVVASNERNVCRPSSDIHKAILLGVAIINSDWIVDCLKKNSILDFIDYEVNGTLEHPTKDGPRRARLNFIKLFPPLFEGCKIYIHSVKDKNTVTELIRYSGASLLTRAPNPEYTDVGKYLFHAELGSKMERTTTIVLYEDDYKEPLIKYKMDHIKSLPLSWFLRCIETFSVVQFSD